MFLAFSILAGFNGRFENYEPGKNIKIYDITGIVPAATDYSLQIKNAPKKGESVGRFDGKNMKHDLLKTSQLDGYGRHDVLFIC